MTKQKKPKVGDTVGWLVIDCDGDIRSDPPHYTRQDARARRAELDEDGDAYNPYQICRIVLDK